MAKRKYTLSDYVSENFDETETPNISVRVLVQNGISRSQVMLTPRENAAVNYIQHFSWASQKMLVKLAAQGLIDNAAAIELISSMREFQRHGRDAVINKKMIDTARMKKTESIRICPDFTPEELATMKKLIYETTDNNENRESTSAVDAATKQPPAKKQKTSDVKQSTEDGKSASGKLPQNTTDGVQKQRKKPGPKPGSKMNRQKANKIKD